MNCFPPTLSGIFIYVTGLVYTYYFISPRPMYQASGCVYKIGFFPGSPFIWSTLLFTYSTILTDSMSNVLFVQIQLSSFGMYIPSVSAKILWFWQQKIPLTRYMVYIFSSNKYDNSRYICNIPTIITPMHILALHLA